MPRGGGRRSGASPVRARSPVSSVPARTPAPAPVAPAPASPAGAQPRQPGLFAQMATTAAGVAVGSAVGHSIGAAMSGGGGSDERYPAEQQPAELSAPRQQLQQLDQSANNPCQLHLKQFLECTQTQHDISLCQGFNDALRECKMRYGITN